MTLSKESVNINDLTEKTVDTLNLYAEKKGVELSKEFATGLPDVICDRDKITQVLINLVMNAVKFTPEGGQIYVKANVDDENRVVLSVTDSGIGMSPGDVVKAMQPFEQVDKTYSRRYQGTGLGLHLCTRIMDLFGGVLAIDSEPGVGTTVTLQFPPERTILAA